MSVDPESLLTEARWLSALARQLTRDAHRADDVAQGTLAAALESPPPADRPVRRWLATVARNLAREWHRRDARRDEREQRAAAPEALPSAHEVAVRLALQRALIQAVERLDEPYRTTIVLRFLEELPPRDVARRMAVPVATVRTRVARALDRLRAELDRAAGGKRQTWVVALAPLARPFPFALPTSLGAALVNAKAIAGTAAAAAAALLGLAFWQWSGESPSPREAGVAAARVEPASASAPSDPAAVAKGEAARTAAAPSAKPAAASSAPASSRASGRVVDLQSNAVAGVEVRLFRSEAGAVPVGVSDAAGRFEIDRALGGGELRVETERTTTVLAGGAGMTTGRGEVVVVTAPRISLGGRVRDESGKGVERAKVTLEPPGGLRASIRAVLDFSTERKATAVTGAAGRFEIAAAPSMPGSTLDVARDGFLPGGIAAPVDSTGSLEIVLSRGGAAPDVLAGRVVDPAGDPVAGALIVASTVVETARSDESGRFALKLEPKGFVTLRALKAGSLPGDRTVELAGSGDEKRWPAETVLRVGEPTLSVAGVVVDGDGRPVPRARVWLSGDSPQILGPGDPSAILESLLAGREGVPVVLAGADGAFRIEGLLPRSYGLHASDPTTLARGDLKDVNGGASEVRVVIAGGGLAPRVAGRVVSRAGEPIAGVTVVLQRVGYLGRAMLQMEQLPHGVTDAEGRFEFRNVAREQLALTASADSILPAQLYELPDPVDDLRIEVSRRCHLKVERPAPGDETVFTFGVRDAEGRELDVYSFLGSMMVTSKFGMFRAPGSEIVAVDERARTIVLFGAQGTELRRIPLTLKPGELTTVRP